MHEIRIWGIKRARVQVDRWLLEFYDLLLVALLKPVQNNLDSDVVGVVAKKYKNPGQLGQEIPESRAPSQFSTSSHIISGLIHEPGGGCLEKIRDFGYKRRSYSTPQCHF